MSSVSSPSFSAGPEAKTKSSDVEMDEEGETTDSVLGLSGVVAPVVTRFALGPLPVGRCNPNALLGHENIRWVHDEPRPAGPTTGLTRQLRHDQLVFFPGIIRPVVRPFG